MLGLGESVTFPAWQLIMARHTVEHERGRLNGFVSAGQGVGPMLGTLFGGLAMARFGWRAMFIGLGAVTLLWIWPWLTTTRAGFHAAATDERQPVVPYAAILQRRAFWGAALGHFSLNYTFYFVLTWLPTFLVKAGGFSVSQMAGIGAAIYGIYAASTAIAGAASDRWIRRGASPTRVRKTFVLAASLGAAVTIACSAIVDPRAAVWFLGAAGVFFGLSTPTIFAIGTTLAGRAPPGAGLAHRTWRDSWPESWRRSRPACSSIARDRSRRHSPWPRHRPCCPCSAWGLIVRRVEPTEWNEDPLPVFAAALVAEDGR